MLLGHANFFSKVYFCVEPLVPLQVGQCILLECVKTKFLVLHSCKSIFVLHLSQDSVFNQPIQDKRIVGGDNHIPLYVLLCFILQQLFAMAKK